MKSITAKAKKRRENQDLFRFQLEFNYSLEFGFWNLDFLDRGFCPVAIIMKKQDLIIIVALFALMLAWPMVYTRFFKPPPVPVKPTTAMETARPPAWTNQASVPPSD